MDIRLLRKSIFLLADLVECQLQSRSDVELPFFSDHILLKSVVALMGSIDLDLQDKVLYCPFISVYVIYKSIVSFQFSVICR